ncbi:MAG: phosphoribosylformylglycinamidine cyclo-ligase [Gammaproteobacteria bacterium]|nr:phosphoribosylformylglycinamidine cyclo-ligase [Gammaproteobacteria bacterium]
MKKSLKKITYVNSGVNIAKAERLIQNFSRTNSNNDPNIIEGIGGFASLYKLNVKKFINPIIVSSTDGVGTKLKLANIINEHRYIGQDLVAMCVNDVITSGATPLFFLDYLATGKLDLKLHQIVLKSIGTACKKIKIPLIGGETAEMPGMYNKSEYDLAGFCVGIVDKKNIINTKNIKSGNIIIGLSSSGIHSNGFSLINKLISSKRLSLRKKFGSKTLKELLIKPTKLYVDIIRKIKNKIKINGAANITGGGLTGNIPRIIPNGLKAEILLDNWKIPEIFSYIQQQANLNTKEMLKTLNCGIGMIVVIDKKEVLKTKNLLKRLNCQSKVIGYITKSTNKEKISYG